METLTCPVCQATNLKSSKKCQNCGTEIVDNDQTQGSRWLPQLQTSQQFTKKQLLVTGTVIILAGTLLMLCSPQKTMKQSIPTNITRPIELSKEALVASRFAGFKTTPENGYSFQDASATLKGALGYFLVSEQKKQKIMFVVLDSTIPVDHLELVTIKVPYTDFMPNDDLKRIKPEHLFANGSSHWGGVTFNWLVSRYVKQDQTQQMVLVGAYKSPVAGKSILVVATPLNKEENLDYETVLWLVQSMAAPLIEKTPNPEGMESIPSTNTADTNMPKTEELNKSTNQSQSKIHDLKQK